MRVKWISFVIVVAALISGMPSLHAQAVGFQTGGASPIMPPAGRMNSPIQPFVTSPIQPFVTPPVTAFGVPPVVPRQHVVPTPLPARVPGSTFNQIERVPGTTRHFRNVNQNINQNPGVIFVPAPGVAYTPGGVVYGQGYYPSPYYVQPLVTPEIPDPQPIVAQPPLPLPGASRAEVIAEFGPPLVSFYTSTQETLTFSGGVVVVLQNGFVVR